MKFNLAFTIFYPIFLLFYSNLSLSHYASWSTSDINQNSYFKEKIIGLRNTSRTIDEITIRNDGEWIIVSQNDVFVSDGFPNSTYQKVLQYINAGKKIDVVAFTPGDDWVVIAEDWLWRTGGIAQIDLFTDKIKQRQNAGYVIDEIALTNNGWIIISNNWIYAQNVPSGLYAAATERTKTRRKINGIQIREGGKWLITADQWFASNGLSDNLTNTLKSWQRNEFSLDHVALAPSNSFLIYGERYSPDMTRAIENIEYSLGSASDNIYKRMHELNIPGLSLAIIDNGEITYERGYGVLEAGTQNWVRYSTPFAIGSTSKYVASLGVMSLVDDELLSLDTTIGDIEGSVSEWHNTVEDNSVLYNIWHNLPLGITLDELLSHRSHMNDGSIFLHPEYTPVFWDITTLQTLLGYGCDQQGCSNNKNTTAWSSADLPGHGNVFKYSNKGYLVVQAMAETVTGQTYPELMNDRILEPLEMTNSIFRQDLPNVWEARTARRHNANGVVLPQYRIPNYAAGGLFTSAGDYAKTMLLAMNDGIVMKEFTIPGWPTIEYPLPVVSSANMEEIFMDRQADDNSMHTQYGYGVEISDFWSNIFTHAGAAGGSSSCMHGEKTKRKGIVILANAPWSVTKKLMTEIKKAFRKAYNLTLAEPNYRFSC